MCRLTKVHHIEKGVHGSVKYYKRSTEANRGRKTQTPWCLGILRNFTGRYIIYSRLFIYFRIVSCFPQGWQKENLSTDQEVPQGARQGRNSGRWRGNKVFKTLLFIIF